MSKECREQGRVTDYTVIGPRRAEISVSPEYSSRVLHSFCNTECQAWSHLHDVLLPSTCLPSDFILDIRSGLCVSFYSSTTHITPVILNVPYRVPLTVIIFSLNKFLSNLLVIILRLSPPMRHIPNIRISCRLNYLIMDALHVI